MSLAQILDQLPALTFTERQLLVRRAIELDEPIMSTDDKELITIRLDDHRRDPASAVSQDVMKESLRSGFRK